MIFLSHLPYFECDITKFNYTCISNKSMPYMWSRIWFFSDNLRSTSSFCHWVQIQLWCLLPLVYIYVSMPLSTSAFQIYRYVSLISALTTRCSAGHSFIRLQRSNPEQLGQVWTQHLSLIQLWIWIVIK